MLYLHVGASHLTTPRPRCETLGVSLGNIAVSKLALECFKITITLLKLKLLPVTGSQSKPILSRRSIRFWERIRSGRCTSTPCTTGHLHHAFLLVGRKLCSAIFTMQPLLLLALLQNRNQTKVLIGVHHKAQNTIEDEWAKTSYHGHMINWKMRMMVTSSRLRSWKVFTRCDRCCCHLHQVYNRYFRIPSNSFLLPKSVVPCYPHSSRDWFISFDAFCNDSVAPFLCRATISPQTFKLISDTSASLDIPTWSDFSSLNTDVAPFMG